MKDHARVCQERQPRKYVSRRDLIAAVATSLSCRRPDRRVIGVVPKATSHLFFVAVHSGVNAAARETGSVVLWNGPREETDYARQIQVVDSMVAQRVDALAISATDERALAASVNRAVRAGIPVTIFDSGVDVEDFVTFVATDNYGSGCSAARLLMEACGPKATVAMLMHKPGGTSTVLREQGFAATLAKEFPDASIVARQFGMSDASRSLAAAENILTAHPKLSGMFASSEASSLGAIQALTTRGAAGKVKLITFDTSDAHIAALSNGAVEVMLVQDAFRIGYEAVKSLAEKLPGRNPPRHIHLPARAIRKADLSNPDVGHLLKPRVDQ